MTDNPDWNDHCWETAECPICHMTDDDGGIVRPVHCRWCGEHMYYIDDGRYEAEVDTFRIGMRQIEYELTGKETESGEIYIHKRCFALWITSLIVRQGGGP